MTYSLSALQTPPSHTTCSCKHTKHAILVYMSRDRRDISAFLGRELHTTRKARELVEEQKTPERKEGTLTAEEFVDLFALCLSWRADGTEKLNQRVTTVDHMVRMLQKLEILSEYEAGLIYKRPDVIRALKRKTTRLHRDGARLDRAVVQKDDSWFVTRRDIATKDNKRIASTMRLYLTEAGELHANEVEGDYRDVIDRDTYLETYRLDREEWHAKRAAAQAAIVINSRNKSETRFAGDND